MGLEKINFGWYLKRISLLALSGYLAGIAVIWLEHVLIGLCLLYTSSMASRGRFIDVKERLPRPHDDFSPEGRMVIRELLSATIEGLGDVYKRQSSRCNRSEWVQIGFLRLWFFIGCCRSRA